MSTRYPQLPNDVSDDNLAREVDSLINTMGVDPMAIEVNGEQQPNIHEKPPAKAEELVDPEVHAAEIALVEAHAKARMAAELERVKAEAAAQRQVELASQHLAQDDLRLAL